MLETGTDCILDFPIDINLVSNLSCTFTSYNYIWHTQFDSIQIIYYNKNYDTLPYDKKGQAQNMREMFGYSWENDDEQQTTVFIQRLSFGNSLLKKQYYQESPSNCLVFVLSSILVYFLIVGDNK